MIYLDNAATTPLDPAILEKMMPYLTSEYGNASSVHSLGREARMAIERARQKVANLLGCEGTEIVFTSSASEANNLAIKGVIEDMRRRFPDLQPEVVVSPIEHPCVIESVKHLESLGWIKVIWLPVDNYGQVSNDDFSQAISDKTALVSVMFFNNEIGTMQEIWSLSEIIKSVRKNRATKSKPLPLYFHTDAVQAPYSYPLSVALLGVDLMSISGHKIYGPKGVGALYVRKGVQLVRQLDGGGQEYYLRAGTENVAAIVGMGEAAEMAMQKDKTTAAAKQMTVWMELMLQEFSQKIAGFHLTGAPIKRAAHIFSCLIENVDSEALIIALDREGIATSAGSACSSGIVKYSHVIEALNLSYGRSSAPLRVSMSKHTTESDIKKLIEVLPKTVATLRKLKI